MVMNRRTSVNGCSFFDKIMHRNRKDWRGNTKLEYALCLQGTWKCFPPPPAAPDF